MLDLIIVQFYNLNIDGNFPVHIFFEQDFFILKN